MNSINPLPEIAVEFNNEDVRKASEQNRAGSWCFIITHINGRLIPKAKISTVTGSYQQAKVKADKWAWSHGCVDSKDSILVVFLSED